MASFKDAAGRDWQLAITYGDVKRCKADAGVDLGALLKAKGKEDALAPLTEFLGDMEKMVTVVFCLVEAQAKKLSVTPENFAEALDGDAIERMADAFFEAFTDFCQSRLREPLRKMAAKGKEVMELARERDLKMLDRPAEELLKILEAGTANGSRARSTASPVNLE